MTCMIKVHVYILFFCRILFGPNHLYVFHHPQDAAKLMKDGEHVETPTFDSANEEIAEKAGLVRHDGSSSGMAALLNAFF